MQDISAKLKIFKALSDENRIKILEHIQNAAAQQACESADCSPEDVCVTNMADALGITAATASHHIKELVNAGLISTTKKGRWVYCQINHDVLSQTADFLNQIKEKP